MLQTLVKPFFSFLCSAGYATHSDHLKAFPIRIATTLLKNPAWALIMRDFQRAGR